MSFDASFYKNHKYRLNKKTLKIPTSIPTIVHIHIHYTNNHPQLSIRLLRKYLTQLLMFFEKLGKMKGTVNIEYYECDQKKYLPKQDVNLSIEHINSGYCYIYSSENTTNIVIYRTEEFYKVLCHELIHLYHIIPFETNLESKFSKLFKPFRVNLNEALVELNALYINTAIYSLLHKKDFIQCLKDEYIHSIHLSKRYLNLMETDWDGVIKNTCEKIDTTNAFSYIILKTFFFIRIFKDDLTILNETNQKECFGYFTMTKNDVTKSFKDLI